MGTSGPFRFWRGIVLNAQATCGEVKRTPKPASTHPLTDGKPPKDYTITKNPATQKLQGTGGCCAAAPFPMSLLEENLPRMPVLPYDKDGGVDLRRETEGSKIRGKMGTK